MENFLRWLLAVLHLLALGIGLGAVWVRHRSLRGEVGPDAVRRALAADNLWGAAALLWLVTGIVRAFGGFEKGTAFYLGHPLFHAKMALLLAVLVLEAGPMIGLISWRRALRRGGPVDVSRAGRVARVSAIQTGLVVAMVGLAAAMARGLRP
jgi:putative membrane protein